MYEKILQKLKEQRGQNLSVSDRSLQDLAKSYELLLTTDELLAKFDFTPIIVSIAGNINHYTAEQIKKENEKREAEKKAAEEFKKPKIKVKKDKKADDDESDDDEAIPEYVTALIESNKKIAERLDKLQMDKTTSEREDVLKKELKDLPDFYVKPILAGFKRIQLATEDDWNQYLVEIKSSRDNFVQTAKEKGLNTATPSISVEKPQDTGETASLAEARKLVKDNQLKAEAKK